MHIFIIIKFTFDLLSFGLLGGSSLAIFSGIFVELIYPKIFIEYWHVWWGGWVMGAALWMLIHICKIVIKGRSHNQWFHCVCLNLFGKYRSRIQSQPFSR